MRTVGARLVSVEPGHVVIEWPYSIRAGRTLSVCAAEVQATQAGKEATIAVMQGTMMAVRDDANLVD
ncbi:MAG: hypothetical protein AAB011_08070 [Candidatus Eisenbacteria bacterium]